MRHVLVPFVILAICSAPVAAQGPLINARPAEPVEDDRHTSRPDRERERPRVVIIRERETLVRTERTEPPDTPAETADDTAATQPPATLDPRGTSRRLPARGQAAGFAFSAGDRLPSDVPQVTLQARRYGLPEPPLGQVYARVQGQVLLLRSATREILEILQD